MISYCPLIIKFYRYFAHKTLQIFSKALSNDIIITRCFLLTFSSNILKNQAKKLNKSTILSSILQKEGSLRIWQIFIEFEYKFTSIFFLILTFNIQIQSIGVQLQQQMKKYCIISTEKRQKLIKEVVQLKLGLAKTARKLKIKLSTAKSILRAFRSKGKILRKKCIKRKKKNERDQVNDDLNHQTQKSNEKAQQLQQIKLEHIEQVQQARPVIQQFPPYFMCYFNWMNMMNQNYP